MKINAEFSKRAVVHGSDLSWVSSPMAGVSRKMLDRVGSEVARATSIVKYEPNSHFSAHTHTGGEEFVVLEGVFQDEHGDYPVGSYIRNPPQTSHTPGAKLGCTILVKLWQFETTDRTQVRLQTDLMKPVPERDLMGVSTIPLYCDAHEDVSIQYWDPNIELTIDAKRGIEVFVLSGSFEEQGTICKTQSWLRLPINSQLVVRVGSKGAKVWIKKHHLARIESELARISDANNNLISPV